MTETANSDWTIGRVLAACSADEIEQLEATGQAADDCQWLWGRKASEWIERGLPKMYVYLAIGKVVGRSATTIRHCFYTWKQFGNSAAQEEYHTVCFSIFNHARQCENPDTVLDYAEQEGAGIDEIETQFPITERVEEKQKLNVPAWTMPIYRRLVGLVKEKRDRAEKLLKELIEIVEAK